MASLELKLLGGFQARLDAGPAFDLPTRKARLLLSYLALPPGEAHPRHKLASLLWSDRSDVQAHHSLRQSLSSLRKALAGAQAQPLVADRQMAGLVSTAVAVDALTFEALLDRGTIGALRRACGLYRGELLAGISASDRPFEEWLFYQRGRLHDLALQAFERLLDHQRAAGESEAAERTSRRLLALSPAHETAHRALMGLFADQGRRAAALEQYRHCRAALERELAVAPGPETEDLHREILAGRGLQGAATAASEVAPAPPRRAVAPSVQAAADAHERNALALPEKPSVAVLPFTNMSGDPKQSYLCDGITEDIITELSRFRSLFVIARQSSFAFRGRADNLRTVGRSMGVQHLVEGSVQKAGRRIRVTVQLIDAESGSHVWAERYDRDIEDIFAVQDEVTASIAGHLVKRIEDRRLEVAKRQHPASLPAYDYWLQGKRRLDLRSSRGIAEGRHLLRRALDLDPQFARAHADMSLSYVLELHYAAGGTDTRDKVRQATDYARTAVSLDEADSRTHVHLGWSLMFDRDFECASERMELAASLNPSDADSIMHCAICRAFNGDTEGAMRLSERAVRQNPWHPDWYRYLIAVVHFLAHRYEDSMAQFRRIHEVEPDLPAWRAAACAQLGHLDEAREQAGAFMRNVRTIWVSGMPLLSGAFTRYLFDVNPLRHQEDKARLLDGLRRAGLPE